MDKKIGCGKKKGIAPFVIIGVAFVFVIAIATAVTYIPDMDLNEFKYTRTIAPLSLTGWTTLSLSEGDFSSDDPNDPFWNEKVWILTVAQGGLGQHAQGTISHDDIKDESGVEPEKNFKIEISYSEQSCEYAIKQNTYTPAIYKYEYHAFAYAIGDLERFCLDNYPNTRWYGKYPVSFTAFCIEQIPQSGAVAYNTIENPYVHTSSTIEVSNGQETSSAVIDTKADIKKQIGDNVFAIWNGYLGRDVCESQAPYYAWYGDGSWKLGWASNYETYKTQYDVFIATIDNAANNGWVLGEASIMNALSLVNNAASNAKQQVTFGQIDNVNSLSSAMIVQDLSSMVSVPLYTFYVKADWLGIYQPIAKPQILDVTSRTFKAGCGTHDDGGVINVKFKNIGEGSGTFSVWAECQSPFQQDGNTMDYTLQPDEIQYADINLCADTTQPVEKTCTVHVKVLNNDATQIVDVSVDPHQVCTPNTYYCEDNIAKKCNEYGSVLVTIEDCGSGKACVYDTGGVASCELTGQCTYDWDCDDGNSCTTDYCENSLDGKTCIHNPISGCGGDETGEGKCYLVCEANAYVNPLDVTGFSSLLATISTIPCKAECWLNYHIIELIVAVIAALAAVLALASLVKASSFLVDIIVGTAVFGITLMGSVWFGVIVIIAAIIAIMK